MLERWWHKGGGSALRGLQPFRLLGFAGLAFSHLPPFKLTTYPVLECDPPCFFPKDIDRTSLRILAALRLSGEPVNFLSFGRA